ncbi:MAG: hypothetical protein ACYDDU_19680 [Dermatophilaceae bacterium]
MEIAGSARKHGVSDEDIEHAIRHPVREILGEGRILIIGADRTGRFGEVVVLDDFPDEAPVIIHAMPLRRKFLPYLR